MTILERTEMSELFEFALSLHLQVTDECSTLPRVAVCVYVLAMQVPPKKAADGKARKHLVDLAT